MSCRIILWRIKACKWSPCPDRADGFLLLSVRAFYDALGTLHVLGFMILSLAPVKAVSRVVGKTGLTMEVAGAGAARVGRGAAPPAAAAVTAAAAEALLGVLAPVAEATPLFTAVVVVVPAAVDAALPAVAADVPAPTASRHIFDDEKWDARRWVVKIPSVVSYRGLAEDQAPCSML